MHIFCTLLLHNLPNHTISLSLFNYLFPLLKFLGILFILRERFHSKPQKSTVAHSPLGEITKKRPHSPIWIFKLCANISCMSLNSILFILPLPILCVVLLPNCIIQYEMRQKKFICVTAPLCSSAIFSNSVLKCVL